MGEDFFCCETETKQKAVFSKALNKTSLRLETVENQAGLCTCGARVFDQNESCIITYANKIQLGLSFKILQHPTCGWSDPKFYLDKSYSMVLI